MHNYYDYDDYYDDDDYFDNATFAHDHIPPPLARFAAAALDLFETAGVLNCTLPDVWADVSYCDVPQLASADTCHKVGPRCHQLSVCWPC